MKLTLVVASSLIMLAVGYPSLPFDTSESSALATSDGSGVTIAELVNRRARNANFIQLPAEAPGVIVEETASGVSVQPIEASGVYLENASGNLFPAIPDMVGPISTVPVDDSNSGLRSKRDVAMSSGLASGFEPSGSPASGVEVFDAKRDTEAVLASGIEFSGSDASGTGAMEQEVQLEKKIFKSDTEVEAVFASGVESSGTGDSNTDVSFVERKIAKRDVEAFASGTETSGETKTAEASGIEHDVERFVRSLESSGAEASGVVNSSANTCQALASCTADEECNGGKCIGAFVGTCDCSACLNKNYWACKTDADCGSFTNGCNTAVGVCDCYAAFFKNNYTLGYTDATLQLCNVQKCTKDSAAVACHGLPCNAGMCFC